MITKDDLVVAVFDDVRHAEQAIADLYKEGFALDKMDMVTRSQGETSATPNSRTKARGRWSRRRSGNRGGRRRGCRRGGGRRRGDTNSGIRHRPGCGSIGRRGWRQRAGGHWRFDHRPLHRSGNARRGRPLLRPGRQGRRAQPSSSFKRRIDKQTPKRFCCVTAAATDARSRSSSGLLKGATHGASHSLLGFLSDEQSHWEMREDSVNGVGLSSVSVAPVSTFASWRTAPAAATWFLPTQPRMATAPLFAPSGPSNAVR